MCPAFGGDGIDRFERHHIWILRQEARDLLKSGRQIRIFAGDQIDDPLVIFWNCRGWSAALGWHPRSSVPRRSIVEPELLLQIYLQLLTLGNYICNALTSRAA